MKRFRGKIIFMVIAVLFSLSAFATKAVAESEGELLSKLHGDISYPADLENQLPARIEAHRPLQSRSIIGEDNRGLVEVTTQYPFSSIVYLSIKYSNGDSYLGSGSMISGDTVLTAAHCLYDDQAGVWAESITVIPGRQAMSAPFGVYTSNDLYILKDYVTKNSVEHDIGLIKLDKDIGAKVGWLGLSTLSINHTDLYSMTGYPGDKSGYDMYTETRNIPDLGWPSPFFLLHQHDSFGGQSGSSMYDKNKEVFAVHSSGGGSSNLAVLITKKRMTAIYDIAFSSHVSVESIEVTPKSKILEKNAELQLTATITPENASNKKVTWKSSNTDIATVSADGLVTAKAAGAATITATTEDGEKKADSIITVDDHGNKPETATILEVGKKVDGNISYANDLDYFKLTVTEKGMYKFVSTSAANTDVKAYLYDAKAAQIAYNDDGNGNRQFKIEKELAPGEYYLQVRHYSSGTGSYQVEVTREEEEVPVTGLTVTPETTILEKGSEEQLTATVLPENATNKKLTWSSAYEAVATVSATGLVTAKATGTVPITATTEDGEKQATSTITVDDHSDKKEFATDITSQNKLEGTIEESIQGKADVDYFKYVPKHAGVYRFRDSNGKLVTPTIDDELGEQAHSGSAWAGACFYLEENKTYFFQINKKVTGQVGAYSYTIEDPFDDPHVQTFIGTFRDGKQDAIGTGFSTNLKIPAVKYTLIEMSSNGVVEFRTTPYSSNNNDMTVLIEVYNEKKEKIAVSTLDGKRHRVSFDVLAGQKFYAKTISEAPELRGWYALGWHYTHIPVEGVQVTPESSILEKNEELQLIGIISPEIATNKNVVWTSSNPEVAIVSATGLVTTKAGGTVTITATTEDGEKQATSTITVDDHSDKKEFATDITSQNKIEGTIEESIQEKADIDYFKYVPKHSGVYRFRDSEGKLMKPTIDDELGEQAHSGSAWAGACFYLEENKTYFFQINKKITGHAGVYSYTIEDPFDDPYVQTFIGTFRDGTQDAIGTGFNGNLKEPAVKYKLIEMSSNGIVVITATPYYGMVVTAEVYNDKKEKIAVTTLDGKNHRTSIEVSVGQKFYVKTISQDPNVRESYALGWKYTQKFE